MCPSTPYAPGKLDTAPAVVMRPIELLFVNHRAPSGPAVMACGVAIPGSVKLDTTPAPEAPLADPSDTGSIAAARPPTTSVPAHLRRPPSTVSLRLIPAPSRCQGGDEDRSGASRQRSRSGPARQN